MRILGLRTLSATEAFKATIQNRISRDEEQTTDPYLSDVTRLQAPLWYLNGIGMRGLVNAIATSLLNVSRSRVR